MLCTGWPRTLPIRCLPSRDASLGPFSLRGSCYDFVQGMFCFQPREWQTFSAKGRKRIIRKASIFNGVHLRYPWPLSPWWVKAPNSGHKDDYMSKLTLPTSHAVRHLVFRCVIKSRTQKYVARNYRQFIEAVYYISIFSIHDFQIHRPLAWRRWESFFNEVAYRNRLISYFSLYFFFFKSL